MLVVQGNIPLHAVFPWTLRFGRWVSKSVDVGHEKLKDVAPAGVKTRVSRCSPGAFFLGNLRQAASVVGGGSRISVAVHERHVIRVAVIVDTLEKLQGHTSVDRTSSTP